MSLEGGRVELLLVLADQRALVATPGLGEGGVDGDVGRHVAEVLAGVESGLDVGQVGLVHRDEPQADRGEGGGVGVVHLPGLGLLVGAGGGLGAQLGLEGEALRLEVDQPVAGVGGQGVDDLRAQLAVGRPAQRRLEGGAGLLGRGRLEAPLVGLRRGCGRGHQEREEVGPDRGAVGALAVAHHLLGGEVGVGLLEGGDQVVDPLGGDVDAADRRGRGATRVAGAAAQHQGDEGDRRHQATGAGRGQGGHGARW